MKFGLRNPSFKSRVSSRTSFKRYLRHSVGIKAPRGYGIFTNPKKAVYNRVYNRTSFSIDRLFSKKTASTISYFFGLFVICCIILFILENWVKILIVLLTIIGLYIGFILLKRYISLSPEEKKVNQSIKYLKKGRYEEVIHLLTPLSSEFNFIVFDLLAIAHINSGNLETGIELWKIILENLDTKDDNRYLIGNKLVSALLMNRKISAAQSVFKDLSYRKKKLNSDLINMGLNIGKALFSNQNLKEGKKILEKILNANVHEGQSSVSPLSNEEIKEEALNLLNSHV